MPFQFSTPTRYQHGDIFLGINDHDKAEIGINTDRHIITIAGARSGKGAALIIPNLKRWPHNALVIDPKGENAEQTWADREAMGQAVHVLDPFKVANVPARLRSALNPLASLDPASLTIREDIRVIADGLVIRYKADDATWDNGAVSVLAGVIAHAIASGDPSYQTLSAVRGLLRLPDDDLEPVFQAMAQSNGMGNLAPTAASIGLGKSKADREFVGGAKRHTEWLDSDPMAEMLTSSSFDLADLKRKPTTVYLVLPPEYLGEHGRFLRLFVRCALNVMSKGGTKGQKCLFILDEFFSLGHIDEIAKAAGLMPGYGVHLWPFLQDLGQLQMLYNPIGSMTFFGNSDAHIFFGNTDQLTLTHLTERIGVMTPDEIAAAPPVAPQYGATGSNDAWSVWVQHANNSAKAKYENEQNSYRHRMGLAGRPRLTPLEIKELVSKPDGYPVARSMIVFAKGDKILNLNLSPYFIKKEPDYVSNTVDYSTPVSEPVTVAPSAAAWWYCKVFAVSWIISFSLVPLGLISQMPSFNYITVMATIATVITLLCWDVVKLPPITSRLKYALGLCGALFISFRMVIHAKSKLSASCSFLCPDPVWIWGFAIVSTAVLSFIWFRLMARWPEKIHGG